MKISKKWAEVSLNWLGIEDGKHCHWCNFCRNEEGKSYCDNKQSKYFDIRAASANGEAMPKDCGLFELSEFYTSDDNYNKVFPSQYK